MIIIDTGYRDDQIKPVENFFKKILEKTFNHVHKTSSVNQILEVGVVHSGFCDHHCFTTSGRRLSSITDDTLAIWSRNIEAVGSNI